jgi:hypothetical protein
MGRTNLHRVIGLLCTLLCLSASGCVQRTLTVTSDPPGALVHMNNQEVGRTPLTRDFTWYGHYDVQVRKEGYQTLNTKTWIVAPIWQWPPLDLFAEFWPFHPKDERHVAYTLTPASTQPLEPDNLLTRAAELREKLESSRYTVAQPPATTAP